MNYVRFIFLTLAIIPLAVLVFVAVDDFLVVDRCMDGGGSFDYSRMECNHESSHPFVPFLDRHALLIPICFSISCCAIFGLLLRRKQT